MKDNKRIIIIGIITIILMILIIFLVGRSFGFFRYVKEGEIVNVITINGIKVEILNPTDDALNLENAYPMYDSEGLTLTPFEFSMTNTFDKELTYSIKIENDTEKQDACTLEDGTICPTLTTNYIKFAYKQDDGTYSEPKLLSSADGILSSGEIASGETLTSSVILWIDSEAGNEIQNHYFFGQLIITGEQQTVLTFKDTILANNPLIEAEPNLKTSSNNTTDESGLYMSTLTNTEEPTYYFRGVVENNYVKFAGFTWRIVRINEDGTIRLIMQDGINENATYAFNSDRTSKDNMYYSKSDTAKPTLEAWYQTNITDKGYSNYVSTGNYFCEQAKIAYDSTYATGSGADMTVYTDYKEPNFICEDDANDHGLLNASIGLLSYDEVLHAGGYYNKINSDYYLYNSVYWWTMSPAGFSGTNAIEWSLASTAYVNYGDVNYTSRLRPVINLKADTVVTGTGTSTDPYKVKVQETDSLTIGQAVTGIDDSKWHVLEASGNDSKYVTLLSDYNLNTDGTYNTTCGRDIDGNYDCSLMAFDTNGSNVYSETDEANIGYFLKNVYEPNQTIEFQNVSIPTTDQIAQADSQNFLGFYIKLNNDWLTTTKYWTRTAKEETTNLLWGIHGPDSYIYDYYPSDPNSYGIRPVVTILKSNLIYE